jgi:hypothetical protein
MILPISTQKISLLAFITAALAVASSALPQPQLPDQASLQESTGQVSINDLPDANTTTTSLPITLSIFSGSPGPKNCRGSLLTTLTLPPPEGLGQRTGSQCYNLPSVGGCGNFVANKDDGCEARLFGEPGCVEYMNTAVFMPEDRAVGGVWRSLAVECGVPAPDPATLGKPPLQGMIKGIKRPPPPP